MIDRRLLLEDQGVSHQLLPLEVHHLCLVPGRLRAGLRRLCPLDPPQIGYGATVRVYLGQTMQVDQWRLS